MTDAQFKALAVYEDHFRTAMQRNYSRNPGRKNLEKIRDILSAINGTPYRANLGCGRCSLQMMKTAGKLYFDEKERRRVALSQQEAATVEKVEIKTEVQDGN